MTYFSISLRASQKNLHFNKLPCDPNVHSSLKATLLKAVFSPSLLSLEVTRECLLKIWTPGHSTEISIAWLWSGMKRTGVSKCLCGTSPQAGLRNTRTVYWNECGLWVRELLQSQVSYLLAVQSGHVS